MRQTDLSMNQFIETKKDKTFLSIASHRIGIFLLILVGSVSPLIISCAPLNSVGEQIKSVYWDIQKTMRKPGEKLITHPDKVWTNINVKVKSCQCLL